jgi:hypothetical protein
MANTYFEWRQGNPIICRDKILQVQQWLAECNPEPMQCYLWAIDWEPSAVGQFGDFTGPRHRNLPERILEVLLQGPLLAETEDPTVRQLRQEGLAEIHRHLNGTILPSLLWSYLINAPQRLSPKSLADHLDGLSGQDCIALLRTAKDLRAALIWRLLKEYVTQDWDKKPSQEEKNSEPKQQEQSNQDLWNSQVLERLKYPYESLPILFQDYVTFKASGLPDYRDPAALLPLGEDEPLIGERVFLYHVFRLFHESTEDAVLAAALHAYLLIQNLIWRALVQPRSTAKGFDRFDRYHSLFLLLLCQIYPIDFYE